MKSIISLIYVVSVVASLVFFQCTKKSEAARTSRASSENANFAGFESQEKWGEHLVIIGGCNDCHTPKKMTPQGPQMDYSLMLSGHPAQLPPPDIDRKEIESKGLTVTQTLTAWIGPWGISYAANLTPDPTGIGSWQESNFITAIRKGKFKGLESARNLLPPMPWEMYRNMTDAELKAVFAYLKSIKPIQNVVPQADPPVLAGK